jgi:transcriptional regulator with XRE-family HTH domain
MSSVGSPLPVGGESFGRRLRYERERRTIALAPIAENTKISISLLEDLERDDVSRWPSGIFRRSFIRSYAAAIGLDADATMREFCERFPDPNDPERLAVPQSQPRSAIRLTLEDIGSSFADGRILPSSASRWAAIASDVTLIAVMGLVMYVVIGKLWMPLCIASTGYYAGGILLLGNTPGVCLWATGSRPHHPPRAIGSWRRIQSYAASIVAGGLWGRPQARNYEGDPPPKPASNLGR